MCPPWTRRAGGACSGAAGLRVPEQALRQLRGVAGWQREVPVCALTGFCTLGGAALFVVGAKAAGLNLPQGFGTP